MPPAKKRTSASPARRKSARTIHGTGDAIRVRGARQNNLKSLDLDIPLGELTVVTGPSGSGKSSLAFQTLYAEGQRRYVETFSPYVRQFFDRMDKPLVDRIDGIPPAIAIEQKNNVRSTRSTVGTITEINDYLKLLFARCAHAVDPSTGDIIRPDTSDSIAAWCLTNFAHRQALILFPVEVPANTELEPFFAFLQQQGYLRVYLNGQIVRTDNPGETGFALLPPQLHVIQDRITIRKANQPRILEALERALDLGKGTCAITSEEDADGPRSFTTNWSNPLTGFTARPPTPSLFSFNNPVGACPSCRGFGRVIGIDLSKAIPDHSLSIREGCVKPFQGERGEECQRDLELHGASRSLDLDCPFSDLSEEEQNWVLNGERADPEDAWENDEWYGVQGFFEWLEGRAYKMHVRVFLSRYRSYTTCRSCQGTRLQPEALCFQVDGRTLPEIWQSPVSEVSRWMAHFTVTLEAENTEIDKTTKLVLSEIMSRLRYLCEVGLGYLTLDRATRTLSGGEIERVNLTSCLGASLTNTLFVLDEPTVGLHPRDIGALVSVMQGLRDKGNTLLVVEHEEAVMRAADYLLDIGPGAGEHGGDIVASLPGRRAFQPGSLRDSPQSSTLPYLLGKRCISVPSKRRKPTGYLGIRGASRHNLAKLDADIPLGVFACVTGVSGSGKSTLVHDVLYQNLAASLQITTEAEPAPLRRLIGAEQITSVKLVDQSPLSRTPRSTPVVYLGAFDLVRQLFAGSPDGKLCGATPGFFSFNSGTGRCERCSGNGFEKVEMQFLSDLYLTCPQCEGSRYSQAALEIRFDGKSIAEVLALTVTEAMSFFARGAADNPRRATTKEASLKARILLILRPLEDLGLGYLRLGQPLNTLSGGESQRLKLCTILVEALASRKASRELLILDEPTTGLHFGDIEKLLSVFERLVDIGHSLLVIEHNLDVIKSADYLIDVGPGAGSEGGRIIAKGTPEEVVKGTTETALYLAPLLGDSQNSNSTRWSAPVSKTRLQNTIQVSGAREHNLKNVEVAIPRDKFVVVTGLSGSGKSTLAFDIIFAEGQRRFLDSMSPYARQFAEQMEKPDIDFISGLPPTVAIEQRISQGGGKSTVATVTEIYHFLRLLYAKLGTQYCPVSGEPVIPQTENAIVEAIRSRLKRGPVDILAPVIRGRKGFHTDIAAWAERQGYERLLVDNQWKEVAEFERLERFKEHDVDVLVLHLSKATYRLPLLREAVATALRLGKGTLRVLDSRNFLHPFSKARVSPVTGRSFEAPDPAHFSFNSPRGWCKTCRGHGEIMPSQKRSRKSRRNAYNSKTEADIDFDRKLDRVDREELVVCPDCRGSRLNEITRAIRIEDHAIQDLTTLPVSEAAAVVKQFHFAGRSRTIARDIIPEIVQRLLFLEEVGLGYLQLDRSARTLSGGEAQRIRLAAQLGSNLRGVLYVLDEPTIGLHPRDNQKLLDTLEALRAKGNSLLVVEHDDDTMERAGHIIDLGPGAGRHGGEIVAAGTLPKIRKLKKSITGRALANPLKHPIRETRRPLPKASARAGWLRIKGCSANNLKKIEARIPLERLTVITGISGCGKSSLMRGTIAELFKRLPNKTWTSASGVKSIRHCYEVDQSPIGKTSRSCPATYVKIFDEIRKLFAQLPESRMRGFDASRFSFNNAGGQCPLCKGNGRIKLEMDFLPSTWTHCDGCNGKRYNPATLEIQYNGQSIGDVLAMTIDEAADFFSAHGKLHRTLSLLKETGLGYLQIGQPSPTLSGGEAQRVKLVTELTRGRISKTAVKTRKTQANLYLIEEPSIGLHLEDVKRLIDVLHRLVDEGHTVVVVEHHTGIMAEADNIIDMGPEAGEDGGRIVVQGTPEKVANSKTSRTAPFLKAALEE